MPAEPPPFNVDRIGQWDGFRAVNDHFAPDAEVNDTVSLLTMGMHAFDEHYEAELRAAFEQEIDRLRRSYANSWVWGARMAAAEKKYKAR